MSNGRPTSTERGTSADEKGTSREPHRIELSAHTLQAAGKMPYGLPKEATGLHPPETLRTFRNQLLGWRDIYDSVTERWEFDVPDAMPDSPQDIARRVVRLSGRFRVPGRGRQYGRGPILSVRYPHYPHELLRQLAMAAAYSVSLDTGWIDAWSKAQAVLEVIAKPSLRRERLWPWSPSEDDFPAFLVAAAEDPQLGAALVRSAWITVLGGPNMHLILRAHDTGATHREGLLQIALLLADLCLASDDSLNEAGRDGMYSAFVVILNHFRSGDPFDVLVDIVLWSAYSLATKFEEDSSAERWPRQAGILVAAMQAALLREGPQLVSVTKWWSVVGVIASTIFTKAAKRTWPGFLVAVLFEVSNRVYAAFEDKAKGYEQRRIETASSEMGALVDRIATNVMMHERGAEFQEDSERFQEIRTLWTNRTRRHFGLPTI